MNTQETTKVETANPKSKASKKATKSKNPATSKKAAKASKAKGARSGSKAEKVLDLMRRKEVVRSVIGRFHAGQAGFRANTVRTAVRTEDLMRRQDCSSACANEEI